jgi:hypothetical protein
MSIINQEIIIVGYRELIREFENKTGWSSAINGVWNADFTKTVFDIELIEIFQREQDWIAFVYPDSTDIRKKNKESLLKEENIAKFKNNVVYSLYLVDIIDWMILNGHLPDKGEFLVMCK